MTSCPPFPASWLRLHSARRSVTFSIACAGAAREAGRLGTGAGLGRRRGARPAGRAAPETGGASARLLEQEEVEVNLPEVLPVVLLGPDARSGLCVGRVARLRGRLALVGQILRLRVVARSKGFLQGVKGGVRGWWWLLAGCRGSTVGWSTPRNGVPTVPVAGTPGWTAI